VMKLLAFLFASTALTAAAQTCTITLSSSSLSVPVGGGTYGPITVTASDSSCQRGAASSVTWIHINYGNAGTGNGTFGFSVDPATQAVTRTGTISAGNATFTVIQAALPCNLSVSGPTSPIPLAGGSFTIAVTAENGCAWTAASSASWIVITTGAGT